MSRPGLALKDRSTPRTAKRKSSELTSPSETTTAKITSSQKDESMEDILKSKAPKREKSTSQPQRQTIALIDTNDFSNDRTVYIEGLPFESNEEEVRTVFSSCGKIVQVRLPTWHDSSRLLGYGHIVFTNATAAKKALELDGERLGIEKHLNRLRYLYSEPIRESLHSFTSTSVATERQVEGGQASRVSNRLHQEYSIRRHGE